VCARARVCVCVCVCTARSPHSLSLKCASILDVAHTLERIARVISSHFRFKRSCRAHHSMQWVCHPRRLLHSLLHRGAAVTPLKDQQSHSSQHGPRACNQEAFYPLTHSCTHTCTHLHELRYEHRPQATVLDDAHFTHLCALSQSQYCQRRACRIGRKSTFSMQSTQQRDAMQFNAMRCDAMLRLLREC
jgi:hypothetical protein